MASFLPGDQSLTKTRRMSVLALSATVFTTAVSSILVLAFKADASISYSDATSHGTAESISSLRPDSENDGLLLAMYPANLRGDNVNLVIGAASMSLFLGSGVGFLLVFFLKRAKGLLLMQWQRILWFLILFGSCILSLIVLVVCAVGRFQSDKFNPRYRSPATKNATYGLGNEYDGGEFDLGSWSCQLSAYRQLEDFSSVLLRQCRDETAALWVGLLLVLSNVGLASLVWLDCRGQRMLIRNFKSAREEHEIYYT